MLAQILDKPIAYHRIFVDVTGTVEGAVMLSQAFYWCNRTRDPDGWFYKTAADWELETGLGRRHQETARRNMRDGGYWEEKLRGVPATLHFRIRLPELKAAIAEASKKSSLALSAILECTEAPNKISGNRQTISETTPETTAKITAVDEAPPKTPEKKGKRVRQGVTQEELAGFVFPPSLETEDFHAAMEEWRLHLIKRRRTFTRSMMMALIKNALEWGAVNAAAYIRYAVGTGTWISVHPNRNALGTVGGTFARTAAERVERDHASTFTIDRERFDAINEAGLKKDFAEQVTNQSTNDNHTQRPKSEYAQEPQA